jgi:hypothetical protein
VIPVDHEEDILKKIADTPASSSFILEAYYQTYSSKLIAVIQPSGV